MRKFVVFVVLVVAAGAAIMAIWLNASREPADRTGEIRASYEEDAEKLGLVIHYPLDETLFPPEIAPATFRWEESRAGADAWLVTFDFQDGEGPISFRSRAQEWTPSDDP